MLDTYIALNVAVKEMAERPEFDGTAMMQTVFSVKNPTLSLSDDPNEQMGTIARPAPPATAPPRGDAGG